MPKLQIISNNAFRKVSTEADYRRTTGIFYDEIYVIDAAQASSAILSLKHRFIVGRHQLEVYINGLYKRSVEVIDGVEYGDYTEITDYQIQFVPGIMLEGDVVRVRITWGAYMPSQIVSDILLSSSKVGRDVFGDNYDISSSTRTIGNLDSSTNTPDLRNYRTWKVTANDGIYKNFLGGEVDDIRYILFDESGSIIQGEEHLVSINSSTDWNKIACGINESFAIKQDKSLWSWGANWHGELGHGDTINKQVPWMVGTDTDWAEISAGYCFAVGLKTDGTLWSWGINDFGQLGHGDFTERHTPTQIGTSTDWVEVSCGYQHVIARDWTGQLYCWGRNDFGQLGLGNLTSLNTVTIIPGAIASKISTGHFFSTYQDSSGLLYSTGANAWGQLGLGDTTNRSNFIPIGVDTDWIDFSAGNKQMLAVKNDNSMWSWGRNHFGQLGLGDYVDVHLPTEVTSTPAIINVKSGPEHTIAIRQDGAVIVFGKNTENQLALYNNENQYIPQVLDFESNWIQVDGGKFHSLFLKDDGTLWSAGSNEFGQLGIEPRYYPIRLQGSKDFKGQIGDTIQLLFDGNYWFEISRSLNS